MSEQRCVLVAMDESDHADDAFEFYIKFSHRMTDRIVLLYVPEYHTVIQSPMVMTDVSVVTDLLQAEESRIKSFLEQLANKLKKARVGGRVKSVGGDPGEVVCKVAVEEKASLLVVGSRGSGGSMRKTPLGSVSDYVMHHARVPVLVCKKPEPKIPN